MGFGRGVTGSQRETRVRNGAEKLLDRNVYIALHAWQVRRWVFHIDMNCGLRLDSCHFRKNRQGFLSMDLRGVIPVAVGTLALWLLLAGELTMASAGTGILVAAAAAVWSRYGDLQ